MQKITFIMAHASDGAIGYKEGLPWPHHSEDMKRFREATIGAAMIMGRTTWDSLGKKPLKYRQNIVLTSRPDKIDPDKANAAKEIEKAIELAGSNEIFFIGGRTVYSQCMVHCNRFLLTEIHGKWPADTYFKVPFLESKILVNEEGWNHPDDPSLNCTFREYINK